MAGETGTTGSGFPVFKSEGGAFDRAKLQSTIRAGAGSTISKETFAAMEAADSVSSAAKTFYDDIFDKTLKELDPALDPNSIFYKKAYDDSGSDRGEISRKIDKGEAVDGKEIFEMAKGSASNKIENVKVLKTGKPTEIIENIGYRDIEKFEAFEEIKNDFNKKVTDDKFKFEPLADKFLDILSYFNSKTPLDARTAGLLYTPENNAIISAISKILEAKGFNSEAVLNMSKRYDENINKLIEKSKSGTVEDIRSMLPGGTGATGPTGTTTETKLEEKKTESPTGPTGSTGTAIEGTNTVASATTGSTGPTTTTTTETITTVTTSTTGPTGSSTPGKVEGAKTSTTGGTGATGVTAADVKKRQEDLLSSILGIKFEAATGGTGTTGENDKKNKEPEKKKEETKLEKPEEKKTEENKTSAQTPTTENKETKLEEKISPTTPAKTETSSTNTPIKETEQQNLSSVIIPEGGSTGDNQNKQTEGTNQNTTTSTETKTTETKTEGGGTTNTQSETIKTEDKTAAEDKQKMDNEMAENMKAMVGLLTRLNNTLQNPLVVIPNNKKFG